MASPRIAVARWPSVARDNVENYHTSLRAAGIEPVDFCETSTTLEGFAGLLLTGGVDVAPSLYGEKPHPKTDPPQPERDAFELALLNDALNRGLPLLAICRGFQLLNVALGGSLLQHIESGEHVAREDGQSRWHEVEIESGTRLASVYGEGRMRVNSRHHQALTRERLAPGLCVAATSADELVEAGEIEGDDWVVGVQWHPERPEDDTQFVRHSRSLFESFAAAAKRRTDQS